MPYVKQNELMAALRSGIFKPVYLFGGEEVYLQEEALRYLEKKVGSESFNIEVFYAGDDRVDEMLLAYQTLPFMSERRLIVVKDAHKLKAAETQELAAFFAHPVMSSIMVFLWQDKIRQEQKRNKLFAAVEKAGDIVDFRALYDRELPAWVQGRVKQLGKTIAVDAAQHLIQESGSSLLDLGNEIEKLDLFTGSRTEIALKDVELLSGHTRTANLNSLANEIEAKKKEAALATLENLVREGEIPLRILVTVYRVVRRLLAAKSREEEKKSSHQEIRQELNLNPYFDAGFFKNLARFTRSELERDIELLLEADHALKSSSRPEELVLEEMVLSITGEKAALSRR